METGAKIFVAGHQGLVGSGLLRVLEERGFRNLLVRSRSELELTNQEAVYNFFETERPEFVFMAAGRSGGILANSTYPAEFITTNILIQSNLIHSAWKFGVKKLFNIACSCIYPRDCAQPIREESFLQGPLEHSSEPFAIAKIAGITMCQSYNRQYGTNFISVVPATLYGPHDNFDPTRSHFLSSFLVRFHKAKLQKEDRIVLWGTGTPERELLFVDDFSEACLFLMDHYDRDEHINVGCGKGITIEQAAHMVKEVVGFQGEIVFDRTNPDGAPRKVLDSSKLVNMGWRPQISLWDGIKTTYDWYLKTAKLSKSG